MMSGFHLVKNHYLTLAGKFPNPLADKIYQYLYQSKGNKNMCRLFDFSYLFKKKKAHWKQNQIIKKLHMIQKDMLKIGENR